MKESVTPDTPCFITLSLPVQGNASLQSPHNSFLPSSNTTLMQVSLSSVTVHHRKEPQKLLHTHVQNDSHSSRHPYLQSQVTRSPRIEQELYTRASRQPRDSCVTTSMYLMPPNCKLKIAEVENQA